MPSAGTSIVALVVIIAIGVGASEFQHALEPGRSEAQGITLNTLVDRNVGSTPNDWYSAAPTAPGVRRGDTLMMTAPATGRMVISRVLPVYPHRCYELIYKLRVLRGEVAIAAYDEEVTRFSDYTLIGPAAASIRRFRFNSDAARRITLAIAGRIGTRASLHSMQLVPAATSSECTAGRPGVDIGAPLRASR